MAANGSIGRLYVSVGANVKPALKELNRVQNTAAKTSDALKKVGAGSSGAEKVKTSTDKAKASTKGLGDEAKKTGDKLKGMGNQTKAVGKPIANLQAATYRLSQAFVNLRYGNPLGVFSGLASAATSTGRAMGGVASKSKLVAAGFAAVGVAAALAVTGIVALGAKLAKFGLQQASTLETLRIQYEGLLGTAAAGAAEVEYILNLGKESVVPTEGLLEANRLLLAYGVSATETRRELVKFFSDFGSATGLSAARLQDMAYALGQVEAQGKANQIDMRQLANAGLNLATVYEKIAEQQGISAAAAKNLTSEGKLTAAILTPAIIALGDNYAEAAEKARNSTRGILANLKDITQINAGIAFEDLLESLKPALKFAEQFVEAFDFRPIAKAFSMLVENISSALNTISVDAGTTANNITESIAWVVNAFGKGVSLVIIQYNLLFEAAKYTWNAISQITFGAIYVIAKAVSDFVNLVITAISFIPGIGNSVVSSLSGATKAVNDFTTNMQNRFDSAVEGSEAAGKAIGENLSNGLGIVFSDWTVDSSNMSKPFTGNQPVYTPPKLTSTVLDDEDGKKKASELESALKSVTSAYGALRDMAAKPLGSASAIEKSLAFDAETFAGNASSIVSSYSKMKDSISDYYDTLIEYSSGKAKKQLKKDRKSSIALVKAQYKEIYELAKANEVLAKKIESQ